MYVRRCYTCIKTFLVPSLYFISEYRTISSYIATRTFCAPPPPWLTTFGENPWESMASRGRIIEEIARPLNVFQPEFIL